MFSVGCHWDVEINKSQKSISCTCLIAVLQYTTHWVKEKTLLDKTRFFPHTSGTYKHLWPHQFDMGMAALQWDFLYSCLVKIKPECTWPVVSYYFETWLHTVQCSSIAANHQQKSRHYITQILKSAFIVTSISPVLLVMLDWKICPPQWYNIFPVCCKRHWEQCLSFQ